jgi:hypothetical protein
MMVYGPDMPDPPRDRDETTQGEQPPPDPWAAFTARRRWRGRRPDRYPGETNENEGEGLSDGSDGGAGDAGREH